MKITKEVSEVTIEFAGNGYIVKASGRDDNDEWVEDKAICLVSAEVHDVIAHFYKIYLGTQ